jgi:hypothetical protein
VSVTETPTPSRPGALAALRAWPRRAWLVAGVAAVATFLLIGLPTDVVPNPVFGRPVEVTWWAPWVLLVTAVLGGLVAATYGRAAAGGRRDPSDAAPSLEGVDRPGRLAGVAGLLGFFAVGCPVCNKLVVVALGTSGALQWFAPIQPILAVASLVALVVALRVRLRGQVACGVGRSVAA